MTWRRAAKEDLYVVAPPALLHTQAVTPSHALRAVVTGRNLLRQLIPGSPFFTPPFSQHRQRRFAPTHLVVSPSGTLHATLNTPARRALSYLTHLHHTSPRLHGSFRHWTASWLCVAVPRPFLLFWFTTALPARSCAAPGWCWTPFVV